MARETVNTLDVADYLAGDNISWEARRKARYGRRSWLIWWDKEGSTHAAACSPEAVKQAMLATGTQKQFLKIQAGETTGMSIDWSTAAMWLRHAKAGLFFHFK